MTRHAILATISVLALASGALVDASAQEAINPAAFKQLTDKQKLSTIVDAFEARLKHARNLSYAVDLDLTIYTNANGKPKDIKEECAFRKCRAWHLERSFRVESDFFDLEDRSRIAQVTNSGFDADEGVARSTITQGPSQSGRIDTVPDRIVIDNRYAYWLDGEYPHREEFIFRDLLKHQNDWRLGSFTEDTIQLTAPFQPWWEKKPGGKRVLNLDPSKGFMPISGESRWDGLAGDGSAHWRIERFSVEESEDVDGVWMPTILHEEIASSASSDTVAVYDTRVKSIEHGTVTPDDLWVTFPKGMEIVDGIRAVTYVAGADGNPAGPETPVYGAGDLPVAAAAEGNGRLLWVTLNFGVVLLLLFFVVNKWRKQAN